MTEQKIELAKSTASAEKAKIKIPQLTDKELLSLYARIKPVVSGSQLGEEELGRFIGRWTEENKAGWVETDALKKGASKSLFWIKEVNPRNVAFTWGPEAAGLASGLKKVGEITTYHTWGYYGFFKPTIDEVLAQIPKELVGKVCAFETVPSSYDINKVLTPDNKYHIGKTTLYAMEGGGVKKLLRGERRNWSARREAREEADRVGKKTAEIEALGRDVTELIVKDARMVTYKGDTEEQISSYSGGISEDFRKLLEYFPDSDEVNELRKNTLKRVLNVLNDGLKSGEISVLRADLALEQLGEAMAREDYTFGLDGMSSSREYDYWGEEAIKLAKSVLAVAHERFQNGSMRDYTAEGLIKHAKPFISVEDAADQLFLMEVMKPVLEAEIKRYNQEDRRKEVMRLIHKE